MADIYWTVRGWGDTTGKIQSVFKPHLGRRGDITRRIRRAVLRGCKKGAEFLLEKSREIVPIDTSLLHDTSRVVAEGNVDKGTKTYAVVYDQEYALIQHETPPPIYTHKPGKSWKYLEKPARVYRRVIANLIRDEVMR